MISKRLDALSDLQGLILQIMCCRQKSLNSLKLSLTTLSTLCGIWHRLWAFHWMATICISFRLKFATWQIWSGCRLQAAASQACPFMFAHLKRCVSCSSQRTALVACPDTWATPCYNSWNSIVTIPQCLTCLPALDDAPTWRVCAWITAHWYGR